MNGTAQVIGVDKVLKRNNTTRVNLHSEVNDTDEDEWKQLVALWLKEFHVKIAEYSIDPYYVYKTDQTDLYYMKLPNPIYVKSKNK